MFFLLPEDYLASQQPSNWSCVLTGVSRCSIGLALTDTLDDLISAERISPQLAMKILSNFDQAITESLQKGVKSRLQFKVRTCLKPVFLSLPLGKT